MSNLIILDRDGVINEDSDQYVKSVAEWQPIPGSIEAIARLSQAGYLIAVATNQSGLARGFFTETELTAMHDKMISLVAAAGGSIASICYCPHGPNDNCTCRKPLPGLLYQIEQDLQQPVAGAWLVGDSLRDLEAAQAAGCNPVLVKTGKGEKTLQQSDKLAGIPIYNNLADFAAELLERKD